jgi:hypothetical protein
MEESIFESLGQSLAGKNEWVSTGILVLAHESLHSSPEASEVDLASTLGFPPTGKPISYDISSEVSNFSNIFEIKFRISHTNIFEIKFRISHTVFLFRRCTGSQLHTI